MKSRVKFYNVIMRLLQKKVFEMDIIVSVIRDARRGLYLKCIVRKKIIEKIKIINKYSKKIDFFENFYD